jgi:tyrosine-protein kinase Etk/Wzc
MSTYDMPEFSPAPGNDEDEVMRDLGRMVIEQIWWVVGIAGAVFLAAVIYAHTATRIYSADALLQVEATSPNASSVSALSPFAGAASGMHTDAEIEIMKSRAVVEPVVEQFKLNFGAGPNVMPYLGPLSALFAHPGRPMPAWFGMRSYAWGGEQFRVDSVIVPKALEGVTMTLRALGNGRYELFDPQQQKLLEGTAGKLAQGNGVSLLVAQLVARPGTEFYVTRANQLDAVMGLARVT